MKFKRASGSMALIDKIHRQARSMQCTKATDLNGLLGITFLGFQRSGAISRPKYLTPFAVKGVQQPYYCSY